MFNNYHVLSAIFQAFIQLAQSAGILLVQRISFVYQRRNSLKLKFAEQVYIVDSYAKKLKIVLDNYKIIRIQ